MAPFPSITFTLLDMQEEMRVAWEKAFGRLSDDVVLRRFTFVTGRLEDLKDHYDCMVSPANSYGIMDGGYDHYLSKAFQPSTQEYDALTRAVQATLYKEWVGYAPPGTCTLVTLPKNLVDSNKFGCTHLAVVPSMRTPEDVTWDKDIVYNCMWSLLAALAKHYDTAVGRGEEPAIKTVLLTGLATGCGRVSYRRCAEQMALAVRHFSEARVNEDKWRKMNWRDVGPLDAQIGMTRQM